MYVILSSSLLWDVDMGVSKWYLNPTGENLQQSEASRELQTQVAYLYALAKLII